LRATGVVTTWSDRSELKEQNDSPTYLRTSSAANVGADKDSDKRQRDAIAAFAKRAGFEILAEFLRSSRERR
jgi:hypothetical protein